MKEMVGQFASDVRCPANWTLPPLRYDTRQQKGGIAVMFAGLLMLIIGFFGFTLDLSRLYNRKAEMQGTADAVALAAARRLNGTPSGITAALTAARNALEGGQDQFKPKYQYNLPMVWSDAAIKFGRSPDGGTGWLDAGAATASPLGVAYVRVDTGALDPAYGSVNMLFMAVLASPLTSVNANHIAVAGTGRINATPLAICAMSPDAATPRPNLPSNDELVEYGFRRGVGYDLMKLNSDGTAPVHFLVDPIAGPGSGSSAANFTLSTVGPYVCTGTMAVPKVSGGSVSVQSDFPIGSLFNHLNSRFDLYGGQCDPSAAPPDTNIKSYTAATVAWMNPKPIYQTANTHILPATATSAERLQTIADLDPPNDQIPTHYGPLWAFARAVPWSSYTPPEPATGYTAFPANSTTWTSLYSTGPGLSGYPAGVSTPYLAGGSFSQLPSIAHRPGIKYRRVLNVPLLACPVSGSVATVLAIGRFFMTVPATSDKISAEFAGTVTDQQIGGPVELYQ